MTIVGRTPTLVENATVTTLTGTLPTDIAAGDWVLTVVAFSDTNANFTPPAGWTQYVAPIQTPGAPRGIAAYLKRDPVSGPQASQVTSGRMTIICQAYGGVDPTTPGDVTAQSLTSTATPLAITGVTTVNNGARLVTGAAVDASSAALTEPTETTLVKKTLGASGGRAGGLADEVRSTAGATGTRTWTYPTGALGMAGFVGALRPATEVTVIAYGYDVIIG